VVFMLCDIVLNIDDVDNDFDEDGAIKREDGRGRCPIEHDGRSDLFRNLIIRHLPLLLLQSTWMLETSSFFTLVHLYLALHAKLCI